MPLNVWNKKLRTENYIIHRNFVFPIPLSFPLLNTELCFYILSGKGGLAPNNDIGGRQYSSIRRLTDQPYHNYTENGINLYTFTVVSGKKAH